MIFIGHSYVFHDLKPTDFWATWEKLIFEDNEKHMLNKVHAWNLTIRKQDFNRQGRCFSCFALGTISGIPLTSLGLHGFFCHCTKTYTTCDFLSFRDVAFMIFIGHSYVYLMIWSQPIFKLHHKHEILSTMKTACSTWSMHGTWQFENWISIGKSYVF